jgi:hypothetical protein
MARRAHLRDLISDRFLLELHHLLWVDPSFAGATVDAGWNCRDHAWLTALLVRSLGHNPLLFHGEAHFIKGPNGTSSSHSYYQRPHTWIAVENVGAIDLSIKPEFSIFGDDYRLPITCVFANEWIPRGKSKASFLDDALAFARAMEELPRRRNQVSAIYLTQDAEQLHAGHLTFAAGWIGSPLTKRLDAIYGNPSDVYAALLLHMRSFLNGDVPGLSALSFEDAWSRLAVTRSGAIARARQLMEVTAGHGWSPLAQAEPSGAR